MVVFRTIYPDGNLCKYIFIADLRPPRQPPQVVFNYKIKTSPALPFENVKSERSAQRVVNVQYTKSQTILQLNYFREAPF